MFNSRTIKIGNFIDNPEGMEKNTRLTKVIYNEKEMYLAVLHRIDDENNTPLSSLEIDMLNVISAVEDHIEGVSYKESATNNQIIFVYDNDNEYINNVISQMEKEFSFGDLKDIEVTIPIWVEDKTFVFDNQSEVLSNPLELYVINYLGESHKLLASEITSICEKDYVTIKDNIITISKEDMEKDLGDNIPVLPMDTKFINVTYNIGMDGIDAFEYKSNIQINFDYTSKQKENLNNTNLDIETISDGLFDVDNKVNFAGEDIELLANAIFEIDERLNSIGLETISTLSMVNDEVNIMVEMWVRWIETGRKTFSQCPDKYKDQVKQILQEKGLDENGKPLETE